ncbi:hypothetical protein Vau01_122350 [Virgisporangium aurantiacum]|uniref:Uncharacterized protein n=1 Tax=Virgisporangium aurantiacum TaxID=175570 RepID=A0A8J4E7V7_9ACTN|nr:hypothetical protein Vau01_122350 [Virgisporangium aurantiacum]
MVVATDEYPPTVDAVDQSVNDASVRGGVRSEEQHAAVVSQPGIRRRELVDGHFMHTDTLQSLVAGRVPDKYGDVARV